jgi:hypothetical protein
VSIIYDGYSYRKVNSLKNGDVVYRCSTGKSCKATVTTDEKGVAVVKITKFLPLNSVEQERLTWLR